MILKKIERSFSEEVLGGGAVDRHQGVDNVVAINVADELGLAKIDETFDPIVVSSKKDLHCDLLGRDLRAVNVLQHQREGFGVDVGDVELAALVLSTEDGSELL